MDDVVKEAISYLEKTNAIEPRIQLFPIYYLNYIDQWI
jgi:hypothetical protein